MWLPIKDAKDYFVNEKGEVLSKRHFKKGIILKPHLANNHCYMVNIYYDNGKPRFRTIHRLVAEAFIPNPDNLPQINHKDENRANNAVTNLEWCDGKYNSNYGTGHMRQTIACSKPCIQKTLDGEFVAMYSSISEAGRKSGFSESNIGKACRREDHLASGYLWEYA